MPDPLIVELKLAYMDVDAAEILRSEAAERANAAVIAATAAGYKATELAKAVGKDRTTIQHRLERAEKLAKESHAKVSR